MREILFRGKRRDNSEWVEGFYLAVADSTLGTKRHFILTQDSNAGFLTSRFAWNSVAPDTVGQYTGLKDKNGKRIFEGDIVRYYERQLGGADAPVIQSVGYEEGGFCVRYYFLNNWLRNAVNGNIQLEGIEIIGNIHDNPELIGGGGV